MKAKYPYYATGRRKETAARVFCKPGKGNITINDKPLDLYFKDPRDQQVVLQALKITEKEKAYDFFITVQGGGTTGQKEAIRHGISRVLVQTDEALRAILKEAGFLTRDSRQVESKQAGLKKSRKKPQFSKR